MDGTAAIAQKTALRIARNTQTTPVAGAIDVLPFERRHRHAQELRYAGDVVAG
jgi:predicted transcriptional regulator